jgi:hypothetical protein
MRINLKGLLNGLLAYSSGMTFLTSRLIEVSQVSQGHRKDKEVESTQELLIIRGWNVE